MGWWKKSTPTSTAVLQQHLEAAWIRNKAKDSTEVDTEN